jgi:hypothetical protein
MASSPPYLLAFGPTPQWRYSMSYGLAVFHFPFVKSGNSIRVLPSATDFSESGEMALMVTESYTSQSGMRLLRGAATSLSQFTGVVVAPPPCPRSAFFRGAGF